MFQKLFPLAAFVLSLLAGAALSQPAQQDNRPLWGVSTGWNQYTEPGLMQLAGPEVGLHARLNVPHDLQLEGDVLLGKQRYTSASSGSMNNVTNIETRWRVMTPTLTDYINDVSIGLGYHTLWNDLRGQTNTGHAGYQRTANQLWVPVRWDTPWLFQFEGGLLVYGQHRSNLSEASSAYSDITNTQRRGHYVQISSPFFLQNGQAFTPFVRYAHLADSNTVPMGGKLWVEPASDRWQLGVQFDLGRH